MTTRKQERIFQVGIRLTREEFEAVRREAERRDWSMAKVMKNRALKGLHVEPECEAPEAEMPKAVGQ